MSNSELQVKAIKQHIEDMLYGLKNYTSMYGSLEVIEMTYIDVLELDYILHAPESKDFRYVINLYHRFIRQRFPGNRYINAHVETAEKLIDYLKEFEKEYRASLVR